MRTLGLAAKHLACAALLLPHALVAAQDLSFEEVVRGGRFPVTMRVEEIPADFYAVKLKVAGGGMFDMLSMLMGPLMGATAAMGGQAEPGTKAAEELLSLVEVVWTKGEVVRIGDGSYLVTYRFDVDMPTLQGAALAGDAKAPPALKLDLVRTSAINALSPRPDITRESFRRAFSAPEGERKLLADRTSTLSNAKQLATAMLMYGGDHEDYLPYVNDTKTAFYVVYPYVKSKEIFRSLNPNGGGFRLNMAVSGVSLSAIEEPSQTPLFYDANEWPDGSRVVAFMDSHVKVHSREEWQGLQRYLRLKIPRAGKAIPSAAREFDRLMQGDGSLARTGRRPR